MKQTSLRSSFSTKKDSSVANTDNDFTFLFGGTPVGKGILLNNSL